MSSATRRLIAAARRSGVWLRGLGLLAVVLAAGLVGLSCAATCRPRWYAPVSVDYTCLPADKQALVALIDGIGDALNAGRPVEVRLEETLVNRWIAARREIEMDLSGLPLHLLGRPCVQFLSGGRLRLAWPLERQGWQSVVTIEMHLALEDGEVLVECTGLRLGYLPVPRSWARRAVSAALAGGEQPVWLERDGAVRLPGRGVWQNGRRPFTIDRLTIEAGRMTFTLSPR